MHKRARAQGVTGTLQVGGQPEMPVGLRLESSYLVVESTVNRDAVAVEFLRRSRVSDLWRLKRTDRPGWQISMGEFPAAWLPQVRRAPVPSAYLLLVTGLMLIGALLVAIWLTQQ